MCLSIKLQVFENNCSNKCTDAVCAELMWPCLRTRFRVSLVRPEKVIMTSINTGTGEWSHVTVSQSIFSLCKWWIKWLEILLSISYINLTIYFNRSRWCTLPYCCISRFNSAELLKTWHWRKHKKWMPSVYSSTRLGWGCYLSTWLCETDNPEFLSFQV